MRIVTACCELIVLCYRMEREVHDGSLFLVLTNVDST